MQSRHDRPPTRVAADDSARMTFDRYGGRSASTAIALRQPSARYRKAAVDRIPVCDLAATNVSAGTKLLTPRCGVKPLGRRRVRKDVLLELNAIRQKAIEERLRDPRDPASPISAPAATTRRALISSPAAAIRRHMRLHAIQKVAILSLPAEIRKPTYEGLPQTEDTKVGVILPHQGRARAPVRARTGCSATRPCSAP